MKVREANPAYSFNVLVAALTFMLLYPPSALALDLGLRCRSDPDAVFQAVTLTVQSIPEWRAIRIVPRHRTVKAVVRNWRSFSVPVWIQVRRQSGSEADRATEVHLMWEQSMEPLSYPDVVEFMDRFREQDRARGLDCIGIGTDVGL